MENDKLQKLQVAVQSLLPVCAHDRAKQLEHCKHSKVMPEHTPACTSAHLEGIG